ncbi:MAG: cytochrome c family protein [Planctomycetaceae bacterium]|nr:hypothetical protein [Phycisphaerales bacterium]MCE2652945.1 cytochrome c family protein [Planctomycetaceae bacterium]
MRGKRVGGAQRWAVAWLGLLGIGFGVVLAQTPRVATTRADFYMYGTQPSPTTLEGGTLEPLLEAQFCAGCHQDFSGEHPNNYTAPYNRWSYTMMSQAYRDPVFQAQFQIAEKDASFSGDLCLRCHAPMGWIQNRATNTNGSSLEPLDTQGVNCITCHRMVDPRAPQGPRPTVGGPPESFNENTDEQILASLGVNRPPAFANGGELAANGYVIDPKDRRRGPFDLGFMPYHNWIQSDFHKDSGLCASCHDVSNPVFSRQPDGTYAPNALNQPHPTGNKYDMFPLDRTYSEWSKSSFNPANNPAGVTLTVPNPNGGPGQVGRYSYDGVTRGTAPGGGPGPLVIFNSETSYQSCQDCHQPPAEGQGCELAPPVRPNVPVHNFAGANSWVLRSVFDLYGGDSGMEFEQGVLESIDRNKSMLTKASDLEVTQEGSSLRVRIINQTGHKLPAGFSEGRRMWVNVRFLDSNGNLVAERGAYDPTTALLSEGDTKVYRMKQGLDAVMSSLANLPLGPSFHLDLNNKVYADNRIPPRGFTNANFEAIQSPPVDYSYADGQFWDDTLFTVPSGAASVQVRVFHQTTTRDYIEFLRDNATDVSGFVPQSERIDPVSGQPIVQWTLPPGFVVPNPQNMPLGQIVYAQWLKWGKSEPVLMDSATLTLGGSLACSVADVTGIGGAPSPPDGLLTGDDFNAFIGAFAANDLLADVTGIGGPPSEPDGLLTGDDFNAFIAAFAAGCP